MKVVSIVGARPQFVKAAAVSRQLRERHTEILIHTGQHYDYAMSGVFFEGLELPEPDVNLGVGSSSHGSQTGAMLSGIEAVLLAEKPDIVVVYGDTNSTLAAALAAAKLCVRVAHIEAGLRSFNRTMPEEINRVLTDHVSDVLLCPSSTAVQNLQAEGISRNVHLVGDVMLDVLNWAAQRLDDSPSGILESLSITPQSYLLATLHRSENVDNRSRLASIIGALNSVDEQIIFPVHPRTRKAMAAIDCRIGSHIRVIDPLGYLDMIALTRSARLVLTDSGGLQKESYWLGVPCLTLRDETEWVETLIGGWNTLVGADPRRIADAIQMLSPAEPRPILYGDGEAATRCIELLRAERQATSVVAG